MSIRIAGIVGLCAQLMMGASMALAQDQPEVSILSPRPLQVVQRQHKNAGTVVVSGKVKSDCEKIEVRFTGKGMEGDLPDVWTVIDYTPASRSFLGRVKVPAGGWYKLEVRSMTAGMPDRVAAVDQVGVGEVFVIAGQSNSTNSGQFKTNQASNMVSSFGGSSWQIANDPQIGVADNSQGGSPWPAFGDAMYAKYKVPIGIASTGFGGTSINQWQPKEGLYTGMTTRMAQLGVGGFRAVLWHQGESDVAMTTDEYVGKLTTVVVESKKQAGWEFPWVVAQVSYHNPEKPRHDTMRAAHQKIWDLGVALPGPDTDTLTGDNRDMDGKGIHFSPKGLKTHGEMWAEKVGAYLDKVLAQGKPG